MNKKILSIAVAAAMAAPVATVSADATIYGVMHYSWDYIDTNDAAGDDTDDQTGVTRASRVGVKGSEDLGGGLKAIYQVETQINTTLGSRNTYVGLSGNWGTLLMGRHDTPYKISTGKIDLYGDTAADYNVILSAAANGSNRYDLRSPQTVAYVSPNMNGITGAIARTSYKVNEGAGDENELWSGMLTYSNGPLYVTGAYEQHEGPANHPETTANDDSSAWKIGAKYTFGTASIGAIYEDVDAPTGSGMDGERFIINGSYKFGNNTLKVQYGDADESANNANDDADYYAVGIDHAFSKRTKAYILYSSMDNGSGSSRSLAGIPGATAGNDVDVLSVGLVHKF